MMKANMKLIVTIVALVMTACCWGQGESSDDFGLNAAQNQSQEDIYYVQREEFSPFQMSIGYVNKQWATRIDGRRVRENLWGDRNKCLHGIQIGFAYQPTIHQYLGGYTGLFFEVYFASGRRMGYDNFQEGSLYVPFHARVTMPISNKAYLSLHGGLGLNLALRGSFTNDDAWFWDYDSDGEPYRHYYELDHIDYGHNGWPKRFNASAEVAAALNINHVVCTFTYSHGLTNHKMYTDAPGISTYQHKVGLSLGYCF